MIIMKNSNKRLMELIRIQKERNLLLKDMESILGYDISFSEELVLQNAEDILATEIKYKEDKELEKKSKEVRKEINLWMK